MTGEAFLSTTTKIHGLETIWKIGLCPKPHWGLTAASQKPQPCDRNQNYPKLTTYYLRSPDSVTSVTLADMGVHVAEFSTVIYSTIICNAVCRPTSQFYRVILRILNA